MKNPLINKTQGNAVEIDYTDDLDMKFLNYLHSLDVFFYAPKVNVFGYFAEVTSKVVAASSFTSYEEKHPGIYLVHLSPKDVHEKLIK